MTLQLAFVAGLVLVYAKWWAWYGGESWGPRFFVVAAAPASLFIAARLRAGHDTAWSAAATVAVLGLSAWVGVAGALENSWRAGFCEQNLYRVEYLCWYVPDFSGLWWPVNHHPPLTAATLCLSCYCLAVFAYLAARPLRELARGLATVPANWAHGWRF